MSQSESKLCAFVSRLTGIRVRRIPGTRSECAATVEPNPDAILDSSRIELLNRVQAEASRARALSHQSAHRASDLRVRSDWSQVDRFLDMGKHDELICTELKIPPADLALRNKMNRLRRLTSFEAASLIRN